MRKSWILVSIAMAALRTQGQTINLPAVSGPEFVCQPQGAVVVSAGGVVATFSKGQIAGTTAEPRFEATPTCGNSQITINLSSFVKNIRLRVSASVRPFTVAGGGSVNPGQQAFVTVAGPRSSIDIFSFQSGGAVRVDMISFELGEQPALFDFTHQSTGRVLIHKYRSDDAYPSPLQTQDGQIRIEGLVYNLSGTAGIPNRDVYFRLIDPPDTADYVVRNGDQFADDNVDGPGTLNGSSTASARSDANGRVSVTLGVTSFAAGDNYQVQMSFDPNFNCPVTGCQRSIVYSAWKRIYVETHKMFKRGSFLREPAFANDKKIVVDDVKDFPATPFDVRLIHASGVEEPSADFYSETVHIVKVRQGTAAGAVELVMAGESDPAAPGLAHAYIDAEKVRGQDRPYLRDAVGIVTGNRNNDYYLPNAKYVNDTFEDAFVEYFWLTDSVAGVDDDLLPTQPRLPFDGAIPFRSGRMGEADLYEREWTTRKWLRNVTRPKPGERSSAANHQALLVGTRHRFADPQGTVHYGLTSVYDAFNDTWIFAREGPMTDVIVRGEATLHELAHQWRVNPFSSKGTDAGGHCDNFAGPAKRFMYDKSGLMCSMTAGLYGTDEVRDGTVGFHYLKQTGKQPDSEYLRIRWRAEPVPQTERTGRNPQ